MRRSWQAVGLRKGRARAPRAARRPGPMGRRALEALGESRGQSSVEYALVLVAFLSGVLALGALWALARDGGLQELAARAGSHALGGPSPVGGMQDVALF